MCNRYGNLVSYPQYVDGLTDSGLTLVSPEPSAAPNLEPLDEIRPTDHAPVIIPAVGGVALAKFRWGFAPPHSKAGPVINFRSDGRTFTNGRCLIPASHFFEFTGSRYPKTKWRFTKPDEEWFCIAGLFRPDAKLGETAFTMLTMPPGPDVAPLHDRQVVVLARQEWQSWLDPGVPSDRFFHERPAGFLKAEQVTPEPAPFLPGL